jgi:hypothetical protein
MDDATIGVLGLIVAMIIPLLLFFLGRQSTSDLWNRIARRGPIQLTVSPGTVSYARRHIGMPEYVIPRPIQEIPVPPSQERYIEDRDEWTRALRGVDANRTSVEVTVIGRSPVPVILHELKIEVLEKKPPLEGSHITYGPIGDGAFVRWLSIDLDGSSPAVTESIDQRFLVEEGEEKPIHFPYRVSNTEPEIFFIMATTTRYDCRWTAELIWTAGGRRGSTAINDNGKPFRTTSSKNADTYASYDGKSFFRPEDPTPADQ